FLTLPVRAGGWDSIVRVFSAEPFGIEIVIEDPNNCRVPNEINVLDAEEMDVQAGSISQILHELSATLRPNHRDLFVAYVLVKLFPGDQAAIEEERRNQKNAANQRGFPVPSGDC